VIQALDEARARFELADAELKSFCFSCPATAEDFEKWKQLREIWDLRDEELQSAREAVKEWDLRSHLERDDRRSLNDDRRSLNDDRSALN